MCLGVALSRLAMLVLVGFVLACALMARECNGTVVANQQLGPLMTWNPMSLRQTGRTELILNESKHCSVVALVGAREEQLVEVPLQERISPKHIEMNAQVHKTYGNQHVGVMLALDR